MKTYEHGGNIIQFAKQLNCNVKDVIDLSSNINFIKANINLDFTQEDISPYPDYTKLYKILSKKYKLSSKKMELFNGGSSAIFSLLKFLDLKKCTIYSPAYLEYKKAAKIFSYKIHLINRFDNIYENKNINKNTLVIFVNPSTPDGLYYDMDKLMKIWMKQKATILIDESFLDFTKNESYSKYIKHYDKLYILKSMTKFYSSASIRLGVILSSKKNIAKLKIYEPLWKISHFDSLYIQDVLKDDTFYNNTLNLTCENKLYLENFLLSYDFIERIYISHVNFILIKLKNIKAKEFQNKLKEHKILIRDCSNFDYLNNYHIRIAVKNRNYLYKLKQALDQF